MRGINGLRYASNRFFIIIKNGEKLTLRIWNWNAILISLTAMPGAGKLKHATMNPVRSGQRIIVTL